MVPTDPQHLLRPDIEGFSFPELRHADHGGFLLSPECQLKLHSPTKKKNQKKENPVRFETHEFQLHPSDVE